MNITNHYWYFKSAIPGRICDDIIKFGLSKSEVLARTAGYDNGPLTQEEIKDLKKKRNSDIVWLNDSWLYKELHPYIQTANRMAGWNYEWDRSESIQFTKYKLNQYYDWHCDSWDKPYDRPNNPEHGKIRKLSMTCQLTDGSEYEGGQLEFNMGNLDPSTDNKKNIVEAKEIIRKGSIIVFPSYIYHRVKPVTRGTRYSLVMWNLGYPFK